MNFWPFKRLRYPLFFHKQFLELKSVCGKQSYVAVHRRFATQFRKQFNLGCPRCGSLPLEDIMSSRCVRRCAGCGRCYNDIQSVDAYLKAEASKERHFLSRGLR